MKKNNTDSLMGRIALYFGHVAGMIDMVALPVWVGTLISQFHLSPQKAGGLATLFLIGVVVASLYCAPRFNRLPVRVLAPAGYAVAALAFLMSAFTDQYLLLACLHAIGGIATGCSLSCTHGTIGRCQNPHRIFALAQFSLGAFSIVFLGSMPVIVAKFGGSALFIIFALVMLASALVCSIFFPAPDWTDEENPEVIKAKIPPMVWFGILGISMMAINQAMIFSFVERVGIDSGFGLEKVSATLIAVGFITLLPALLAVALQRHWPAIRVMLGGPIIQALLAFLIVNSAGFVSYAVAVSFYPFVMMFTHTFVFGFLARHDPSGRAVAATPAMNMIGSAIGPFLGGSLVQFYGYPSLSYVAIGLSLIAVVSFSLARLKLNAYSAESVLLP